MGEHKEDGVNIILHFNRYFLTKGKSLRVPLGPGRQGKDAEAGQG